MKAIARDDTVGKRAVEQVRQRVSEVPHLEVTEAEGSLVVTGSPDGFDVKVLDNGWQAMVYAWTWHGHFEDPVEAADCFMWLLTPNYRVRTRYRRQSVSCVELQRQESPGQWVSLGSTIPLIQWPLGRVREEFASNSLIVREPPTAPSDPGWGDS